MGEQAMTSMVSDEMLQTARERVTPHIHRTPLLHSRTLSGLTGFEVWLKAEVFQRTGSYKVGRGPLTSCPC